MKVFPVPVSLLWGRRTRHRRVSHSTTMPSAQALLDSRSAENFISTQVLQKLNIHRKRCQQDLRIQTIQGKPLGRGCITHFSSTLTLRIGCLHSEEIMFMMLEGSTADIILGRPWLTQHLPQVQWNTREILKWGDTCFHSCLSTIKKPQSFNSKYVPLLSTSIESPETDLKVEIPPEYQAFQDVFSKRLATQLPPHRPWDCAIDILPGATLPKGRVYALSILEQKAMEEYIKEGLNQRFSSDTGPP